LSLRPGEKWGASLFNHSGEQNAEKP